MSDIEMGIDTVLLDMGGVLLDLGDSNGLPTGQLDYRGRQALLGRVAAGRRLSMDALERLVFEPWRQEYRQRYRTGTEASWKPHLSRLRKKVGSRAHDVDLLGAWFGPFSDRCRAVDGARAALEALAAGGVRLGLVSNVPLPGALYRRVLRRHGLDSWFASTQFSYDSGHRKPSPFMLRRALRELGTEPQNAAMVGDRRSSDVAAGRAAGVTTIWLKSEHADGPRPDWTIASIGQLPSLAARLSRG